MKLDDTSSSQWEGFLCLSPGSFAAYSLQETFPPKVAASLLEILLIFFLNAVKYAADRRWQLPYREQGKSRGLTPALQYNCIAGISEQEMKQEGELTHNPKPSQQPKQLFIICGMAHWTHSSQTNRRARSLPWRTYNLWSRPCEMLWALPGRVEQFHLRIILAHLGRSHLSC